MLIQEKVLESIQQLCTINITNPTNMPKTKLPHEAIPDWLISAKSTTKFDRNLILQDSVYYPGSALDGRFLKYYLGFSHSMVYVDAGVSKERLLERINKIGGYNLVFLKDVTQDELCPFPNLNAELFPEDFYLQPKSREEIPNALKEAYVRRDIKPYAAWAVFQRKARTDPGHGPERFSLLFIAGEGIATYSAIYNSNSLYPKAIVFCGADIGFGGNWTYFEKRGGIFERVVMANKAGIPKYLLADNRYDPSGSDNWVTRQGIEPYWGKYIIKVQDSSYLHAWTTGVT